MLRDYAFRLILKLFIWTIICNKYLIGLFKWRVKTIFAPDYAFIYLCIIPICPLSQFIICPNFKYFNPEIFMVGIAWHFENWLLVISYFFLQLFFKFLGYFNLSYVVELWFTWRFAILKIGRTTRNLTSVRNYFFRVVDNWNLTEHLHTWVFVFRFIKFFFAFNESV